MSLVRILGSAASFCFSVSCHPGERLAPERHARVPGPRKASESEPLTEAVIKPRNAAFLLNLRDSGVDFIATDMPHADRFTVGIAIALCRKEGATLRVTRLIPVVVPSGQWRWWRRRSAI